MDKREYIILIESSNIFGNVFTIIPIIEMYYFNIALNLFLYNKISVPVPENL